MANTTNVKNRVEDLTSEASQMASETASKAQETKSGVVERARDMASSAAQSAREMASSASEMAETGGRRADEAARSVGGGMQSLAHTVRERMPESGVLGSARSAVADSLESGGRYLQEHGLRGMGEDLTQIIRRNPVPAVLVGIAVGFLLARATRS